MQLNSISRLLLLATTLLWALSSCTGNSGGTGKGEERAANGSSAAACDDDSDCAEGAICDLGQCVSHGAAGELGLDCSQQPPEGSGERSLCGVFLCKNGFCRSCEGTAECGSGLICEPTPAGYPGSWCVLPDRPDDGPPPMAPASTSPPPSSG